MYFNTISQVNLYIFNLSYVAFTKSGADGKLKREYQCPYPETRRAQSVEKYRGIDENTGAGVMVLDIPACNAGRHVNVFNLIFTSLFPGGLYFVPGKCARVHEYTCRTCSTSRYEQVFTHAHTHRESSVVGHSSTSWLGEVYEIKRIVREQDIPTRYGCVDKKKNCIVAEKEPSYTIDKKEAYRRWKKKNDGGGIKQNMHTYSHGVSCGALM
ncbi:hypothetical protein CBL_07136 [Carabus blaptoides fortunei]